MSSVGETLRRERLRKELSLDQISRETKISVRLLEAIEKDHLDQLPGGVFAKSFVRQYARFLGLDEDEMGAEVERAIHPVSDLSSFVAPPEPAFKVPRLTEWEGSGRSSTSMLPALAGVVTVMLICSAVYTLWQKTRRAVPVAQTAVTRKESARADKPAELPPAVTPAVANNPETPSKTEVVQTLPSPDAGTSQSLNANPAATLHVLLTAGSDVWLHAWADNKSVMEDVLKPGDAKTIDAVDAVRIRTGNAGDLQLTVNGKPAGSLGPRGQIRVVEVTPRGVQSLPPKPPAEPL